jgi:hypothetical protein
MLDIPTVIREEAGSVVHAVHTDIGLKVHYRMHAMRTVLRIAVVHALPWQVEHSTNVGAAEAAPEAG